VALGAGRGRIVQQLLTESVVLAAIGGIAGLALAQLGVRALVDISPPGLPRADAIQLDWRVFGFALLLTGVIGLIVGLIPARGAVAAESRDGLNQRTRRHAAGRSQTRSTLVIAEVALAAVLLVGAGLLFQSVTRLLTVPPGFDASHVITMQVVATRHSFQSDTARLQFYQRALKAVQGVPGVMSAGWTSQVPLSGDVDGYGYEAQSSPGADNGSLGNALRYSVSPGYFTAMRIPLRRGRLIDGEDQPGAARSVVINESMAKRVFGKRDPIGERVRFGPEMGGGNGWDYVVGVVGDVKHYSLAVPAPDAFYIASGQWRWVDPMQTLVVRTAGDAASLAPSLKRAVWSVDRNQPIQRVSTMEQFVAGSTGQRRFAMLVIETFAAVAFVLAAVGLYGVIAGGVNERVREIGIRSALGATPAGIVTGVLRRSLLLAAGGAVIGVVASLSATRLIRTMLFGVSSVDPLTYAGVLLLLLLTAAIAAWAPARRAVGVDPTTALRSD
jgi:putative ABC transport system permease protein